MNYLLPQGLATVATEHHKRMVEKHARSWSRSRRPGWPACAPWPTSLGRQSVTIEANANDEGHLYGSVGAADIVNALKRNKITIAQDQVRLQGPLKELGLYTVKVHLGQEIEGELKVWVVPSVGEEGGGRGQGRLVNAKKRPSPARGTSRRRSREGTTREGGATR